MKKVLASVVLGSAILCVVGCGGGKSAPVTPAEEPTVMPQTDAKGRAIIPNKEKKKQE